MGRKFHIEGTKKFGYSMVNRYQHSFYVYMNTVQRICELYNNASVSFIKGYVAHSCYIRLKSFNTFLKVIVENRDYVTANCIMRMLGDCVAVFHLVYMEPNEDFRLLRHCLYVLDGCECNLRVLPGYTIKSGIPENELIEANKQVEFNIEHRKRMMHEAQEILDKSPLKQNNPEAFKKIVEDRNWKFKEFKTYNKQGQNQYQWRELYQQIDYSDGYDLLSYMSQYAHGLSMSNLVIDLDEQGIDGVIGEALGLLDRMNVYVMDFYENDNLYIIEGLKEPETRDKILACYDDKHRPTIEEWNRNFSYDY